MCARECSCDTSDEHNHGERGLLLGSTIHYSAKDCIWNPRAERRSGQACWSFQATTGKSRLHNQRRGRYTSMSYWCPIRPHCKVGDRFTLEIQFKAMEATIFAKNPDRDLPLKTFGMKCEKVRSHGLFDIMGTLGRIAEERVIPVNIETFSHRRLKKVYAFDRSACDWKEFMWLKLKEFEMRGMVNFKIATEFEDDFLEDRMLEWYKEW